MTDSAQPQGAPIAVRFARLVARASADPAAAPGLRTDVRKLTKALKKSSAELCVLPDGALGEGEAPVVADADSDAAATALLAQRFQAYGVERLSLQASATDADLFDLVTLLATVPEQADPAAFFAARSATVAAKAVPRVLRERAAEAIAEVPSVKEAPSVKEQASVPRPSGEAPAATTPPSGQPVADPRSERLAEALAIPETEDAELRALFATLAGTEGVSELRAPLERLVARADIAFRTGDFDTMLQAIAGLVAIEFAQLERDGSDERRREFAHAVRKLATPVILRQVAGMRRRRAADGANAPRLQAILYRYGTDGAEAMIDEWENAQTPEGRAICLESLRHLSRAHDALFEMVRGTDDLRVRLGIELLAAIGDARAEQLVLEQLRHPDAKVRRGVVAALERFDSTAALDSLGVSLLDEEGLVRLRAVSALGRRGAPAAKLLVPLLDKEPERDVLYATIAALGSVGTPEAVQALIRCANGELVHPKFKGAAFRLQACAALALVRTPQAMAAVQMLRDDRDREVREGATRLVAQAARRGTTAVRAAAVP